MAQQITHPLAPRAPWERPVAALLALGTLANLVGVFVGVVLWVVMRRRRPFLAAVSLQTAAWGLLSTVLLWGIFLHAMQVIPGAVFEAWLGNVINILQRHFLSPVAWAIDWPFFRPVEQQHILLLAVAVGVNLAIALLGLACACAGQPLPAPLPWRWLVRISR